MWHVFKNLRDEFSDLTLLETKGALELASHPVTYLITFACYGCHLHGAGSGSVDTTHNVPGTPVLNEDSAGAAKEERRMDQPAYHKDRTRGDAV